MVFPTIHVPSLWLLWYISLAWESNTLYPPASSLTSKPHSNTKLADNAKSRRTASYMYRVTIYTIRWKNTTRSTKTSTVTVTLSHVQPWPWNPEFFTSYLVTHFSEVWKCGVVWQGKDIVAPFPQSWTSCHSLLSSILLSGVEVWNSLTK